MSSNSKLAEFIERASGGGASDATVVGILTARGWSEKDIYEAIAAHYEKQTGINIPHREGSATAAKDAFFYLLAFATLATWATCLGSLAFDLIDRWLEDSLFPRPYGSYSIAGSLAAVLIAYPIYLFLTRAIVHQVKAHPERLNSPVRKWLTYIALVFAASVFIGDLITTLSFYLRGEITSRFLLKALVVLLISGGVFCYYFFDLRKSAGSFTQKKPGMDGWAAILATVSVVGIVIWGFSSLGAPRSQRTLRADRKRVQDLFQLSTQMNVYWKSKGKLPENLDKLQGPIPADPLSHQPYQYHAGQGNLYDLCGVFDKDSQQQAQQYSVAPRTDVWAHPAGYHCFSLDANEIVQTPYQFYPD